MKEFLLWGDAYKYNIHNMISPAVKAGQFYFGSRSHGFYLLGVNLLISRLSQPITHADIDWALERVEFDDRPWRKLVDKYAGRMPIKVYSVPEGQWCQPKQAAITFDITDPEFVWLGMYVEAITYQSAWLMSTVATRLVEMKNYLESRGFPGYVIPCYNRGSTCPEESALAHAAHGFVFSRFTHHAHLVPGYQFPRASTLHNNVAEHMVILANGEDFTFDWLSKFGGAAMYDTYDKDSAIKKLAPLKNVTLLADDGDLINEMSRVAAEVYRSTGHWPQICQMDNIDFDGWKKLVDALARSSIPKEKVIFSDEKHTAHEVTRDTLGFAFKICSVNRDGEEYAVGKHLTGPKATLRGRQSLPICVMSCGVGVRTFHIKEIIKNIQKGEQ